ncbi:ATP-dependent DNA helicase PIF1 [Thelohanellus kitauei]|uniref:ATP-dependent DNA helicase PIF1 n=1 Tax=Thelohanellus kitauei TaxID=669202 RepID=A0A0C2N3H9_THEKT|nr:ATP-dependent DNA helicase PIF1 [Thelohanellus kitauei]
MRSEGQNHYNNWLLQVESGTLPSPPGIYEQDVIQIPNEMMTNNDIISVIFGNINQMSIEELTKRVIVAPTNSETLYMNHKIIELIPGDPQIYYSADSIISEDLNDTLNYPVEFLNNQTPSGMPPHVLLLKKGVIIMLLRNLNPKKGMSNGTRLIVEELERNFIKAKIISECNRGDSVLIPRIDLAPTETTLNFTLKRRQFPVVPAYAITINKAQGQSFDHVGIQLKTTVFSHGQLYVALSRSRNSRQVKLYIEPNTQQGQLLNDDRFFTRNVVFTEIL